MDLEKRIGQLFMIGFLGDTVSTSSPIMEDLAKRNLGGVILFDKNLATGRNTNNIKNHGQVRNLLSDMQNAARGKLIIGVDQEGGMVNRFRAELGFTETAPATSLGQNTDTAETEKAAHQTAKLLKELGFNLNLAPVVDLNTFAENPIIGKYQRSFSPFAKEVTRHGKCWITSHHLHGIHCCLKHFPGHGSARADSHLGFVDVSPYWQKEELIPYRDLIKEGLVDAVMTGHLYNSVLDSEYPATLSTITIDGLLRSELGFNGPVLSDDLQMKAISSRYGLGKATCLALAAGVDMIIVGNNMEYNPAILQHLTAAVMEAIHDGMLKEERLHQACERVRKLTTPPPVK